MKASQFSLLIISAAMLAGCVERETADTRLVKACAAGIEAFLPDGDEIEEISSQTIRDHLKLGRGHREIMLNLVLTDGFHARDESHSCVFLEEFGFAKMSHRASIYQLNYGGQIIGQENYQIQGSIADMQKLTGAVDKALRE